MEPEIVQILSSSAWAPVAAAIIGGLIGFLSAYANTHQQNQHQLKQEKIKYEQQSEAAKVETINRQREANILAIHNRSIELLSALAAFEHPDGFKGDWPSYNAKAREAGLIPDLLKAYYSWKITVSPFLPDDPDTSELIKKLDKDLTPGNSPTNVGLRRRACAEIVIDISHQGISGL